MVVEADQGASVARRVGAADLVSIEGRQGAAGVNRHLLNTGGSDTIAEFQEEPGSSQDVALDGATAPRASVDAHGQRRRAVLIEPATRHRVRLSPERADRVGRVLGDYDKPISAGEVGFEHRSNIADMLYDGS